jgi:sensor histidine kinase YesM
MKLKTILVINAILLGLFGLTSLLAPEASATPYGLTLDPLSKHLNQVLGAFFLGLAVLSWMSRKVTDSIALRAILVAFSISYIISLIISIKDILSGLGNALGWSSVVLYLLLLIGFGYYLFVKPSAS